jgi:hypothetical protein
MKPTKPSIVFHHPFVALNDAIRHYVHHFCIVFFTRERLKTRLVDFHYKKYEYNKRRRK